MITFSGTENCLQQVWELVLKNGGNFLKKLFEKVQGTLLKKLVGTVSKNVIAAVTPRSHCTFMKIISHI